MSRADSPLAGRMIFNVGARRSGTYWLQRIITAHPDVAAVPGEPHLFSHGIAPLLERFHHGARSSAQVGAMFADREVLLDATRDFCDRVLCELVEPGARFLAERTPLHVYHLDLIAELYPDARFVHIVRDGRDVARSLVSQRWGPSTIAEAAEEWRSAVAAARTASRPDHYLEVRYEDLLARPEEQFRALYDWLGLEVTDVTLGAALAEAKTQANLDPSDSRIEAGKWRTALSAADLAELERVAGPLLAELGYGPATPDRAYPTRPRPRAALRDRARTAARRLASSRRARSLAGALGVRARSPLRRGAEVLRADDTASTGSAGARDAGQEAIDAQSAFDRLLAHIHTGRPDRLADMLDARASVRLVEGDEAWEGRGEAAREALVEAVGGDRAFAGRQVRGEVQTGSPAFSAVLSYELEDGRRAERLLFARLRGGRVRALALYRLGGGEGAGEPPAGGGRP